MVAPLSNHRIRFRLGRVVVTPAAEAALDKTDVHPLHLLVRHGSGDWGGVAADDAAANEAAVAHEGDEDRQERVLSSYRLNTGTIVWLITECDRSITTIQLPSEDL